MSEVTFGYWDIRGLGERVRLLLEYLQVPYKEKLFTSESPEQWHQKLKHQFIQKNPAANLPYLIDGDRIVCESEAIMIYLIHKAKRLDLLGEGIDDQTQVMTVMGVFKDLYRTYLGFIYGSRPVEEFKEEAINSMKGSLTKLQSLLGDRDWFASKVTYVDFIVGEFSQVLSLFDEKFGESFPKLKAHQERVWGLEHVKEYIQKGFHERPINYTPYAKWY